MLQEAILGWIFLRSTEIMCQWLCLYVRCLSSRDCYICVYILEDWMQYIVWEIKDGLGCTSPAH